MNKTKKVMTSFLILGSAVALVSTPSAISNQPNTLGNVKPQLKQDFTYKTAPSYKINDAVIYGESEITVQKGKYNTLQEAIWDQGKIFAYDPAWGFITSQIKIETPNINLAMSNNRGQLITISVIGSNGKKVEKSVIALFIVDKVTISDPRNLKGKSAPYIFTQNPVMYEQNQQANFANQDWQPLIKQSLQPGDIVKIRQINTKFQRNVDRTKNFQFWVAPGLYQRTLVSGNNDIFTKNAWDVSNDFFTFTVPQTKPDTEAFGIKAKDAKDFGLLIKTPYFENLPQDQWPIFQYEITPKTPNSTLKNAPWLVFQNTSNIKDPELLKNVEAWNIKKEAEFKDYWNKNPELTNGLIWDNTILLQLSGAAREQLNNQNIRELTKKSKFIHDQYLKLIGINIDDVNNPKNGWWNLPIASRSYVTLLGNKTQGGGLSSVTYGNGSNILDVLGDTNLIRQQWSNLFRGSEKTTNSDLTNVTNKIIGTLLDFFDTDWRILTNEQLLNNLKKVATISDTWPNLLRKINALKSEFGLETYNSIDGNNELKVIPILQMLKQTGTKLWIETSKLIREYFGFVVADPRKTNPEFAKSNDQEINKIKAQRLEIWSKKYPPLAKNPNFWDFLAYVAIQGYGKDFTSFLNNLGIKISGPVQRYGIEQRAQDVFTLQDIIGDNLSNDFYQKSPLVTSFYDASTESELKKLGLNFAPGNLSFSVSVDDTKWLKNRKVHLFKRGVLIKVLDFNTVTKNFKIEGLEPGSYTLVFPQENDAATKYTLANQTFYVRSNVDNNFVFHYKKTKDNLQDTSRIRFLGSDRVFGVNISYDPQNQSVIFDSKVNAPHHREGGYYGFVLRDKTTDLYESGKKQIDFSKNYYKFISARAQSGVNNVFINDVKLDPTKLKQGKYELWLFHVEGESLMEIHNDITGTQSRFFAEDLSKINSSQIASNIPQNDTYFFTRAKIDETKGFEFLKNNSAFNFDSSKSANYSTSDTIEDRFDSKNMDLISTKINDITTDFNLANPDMMYANDGNVRITLNSLNFLYSYLSADYKKKNSEKLKKATELIAKLQKFERIYTEVTKPLEVEINKPFSPYELFKIVSSKDGTISPNEASVVETNIRVNEKGQYYTNALGTYYFKFRVKHNSMTKEFIAQIKSVNSLSDSSTSSTVINKPAEKKYPEKIKITDYNKNILYSNLNKNRTIVGTNFYISTYHNTIQKVDFDGNVITQINVSDSSINNIEKIIIDDNSKFAYALVSNNVEGNTFLTKVLKIDLSKGLSLSTTYLAPFGIDNIGYFDGKVLLWKTSNNTSVLKNDSAIYYINSTSNEILPFKINDKYFDGKNYITNIFKYDGVYTYKSFDRNEDGTPKSMNYKTFSFNKAYVVFMVNQSGNAFYIVVNEKFENITNPIILPKNFNAASTAQTTVNDFTLLPEIQISDFSYSIETANGTHSPLAKYASQNIKKYPGNKFSYSGFPNYIGAENKQYNINEMIIDVNKQNAAPGNFVYDETTKKLKQITLTENNLTWNKTSKIPSSAFTKLDKNASIGDSVSIDGKNIVTLPIYQNLKDYKNYQSSLDPVNWRILVNGLKLVNSTATVESVMAFDYKSLIEGNLNLNNLTARLTRIDDTHLILGFINSELKLGLTFDPKTKKITAVKLSPASNFIDYKFDNSAIMSLNISTQDKANIKREIDKLIPSTTKTIEWFTNQIDGYVYAEVKFKKMSWIDKTKTTDHVRRFWFYGFLKSNPINYLNNDSYPLSTLKSKLPSSITKEELLKNKIINLQSDIPKENFSIILEPNDAAGTLKITTATTSSSVSSITKSITYSGFLKPNTDIQWIPPTGKIPELSGTVPRSEVQKLFKTNNALILNNLEYSVNGNNLDVKVSLTKDNNPVTYLTSFALNSSAPAPAPAPVPTPTPTPSKPIDPKTKPDTTPAIPVVPITPIIPPFSPVNPPTPIAPPNSINVRSLSAKIVNNDLEVEINFEHFTNSDIDKLVTVRILDINDQKVIDKSAKLTKDGIMINFDNLDKTKKYEIQSIEFDSKKLKLSDQQKVLPQFINSSSTTPNSDQENESKTFPWWIIVIVVVPIAIIVPFVVYKFKKKNNHTKPK